MRNTFADTFTVTQISRHRNKTLNGGRAERNEYILLHEFHRLKYICPDKQWGKKAAPVKVEQDEDGEGGESKTSKGKRDKYKGGLVFEPKRGLWDRFILVMDFNSLYPSIIQEYNIDFTTVNLQDSDVRLCVQSYSYQLSTPIRMIKSLSHLRRRCRKGCCLVLSLL